MHRGSVHIMEWLYRVLGRWRALNCALRKRTNSAIKLWGICFLDPQEKTALLPLQLVPKAEEPQGAVRMGPSRALLAVSPHGLKGAEQQIQDSCWSLVPAWRDTQRANIRMKPGPRLPVLCLHANGVLVCAFPLFRAPLRSLARRMGNFIPTTLHMEQLNCVWLMMLMSVSMCPLRQS